MRATRTVTLVVVTLATLAAPAAAQDRRGREARLGPEHTEAFSRTLRLGRNGTFDLANITGDVTVTGRGGDDVRIDATKRVRNRSGAEAKALLQEIQILVSERSGLVEVRTDFPRRRNWSGGVDFTIAVPNGANVTLRTINGTLRVSNVRGELRAETVSGDLVADALGRVRLLKTVSGDLHLTGAEGDDVALATVSGDVNVRGLKARSVELESVSGDLRFIDVECDRVNVSTVNGDIEYNGRLARSGRYEMQSHSGDIRLLPAGNTGFDLDARTFSGDIRSDFQLSGAELTAPRRPGTRTVRGTVGDASAILTLRVFSGDIMIMRP